MYMLVELKPLHIQMFFPQFCYYYSYALFERAIRPDIQPKSSRSHEAEPSVIWMTEGEYQAGLHFPTGRNKFITCSFMIRKNNKYISISFLNLGGQNDAAAQLVILNSAVRY